MSALRGQATASTHPLPTGYSCNPYTPEFQSRALPNPLCIAPHWKKNVFEMKSK